MRCQFAAKPGKIESSIDLPHQMIFGNRLAKMKLVEQLTLVILQTAHHGSTSPRFASAQRNHGSRPVSTDFCNKIGQKRKSWLSFDHFVGAAEHREWKRDAERAGGLEIDFHLNFRDLLYGQIGRQFSSEN